MQLRRIIRLAGICFDHRFRRLLTPYLDGELDWSARAKFELHLERCAVCRAERDRLVFASEMISRLTLPDCPPAGMPLWAQPKETAAQLSQGKKAWKFLVPLAASIILITLGLLAWRKATETRAPEDFTSNSEWEVMRLSGAPSINSIHMGRAARLKPGDWLETDDKSRALLNLGLSGQVEVDQNTRIRLVESGATNQRLALTRGRVFAAITAPPRIFFIETPAGLAVDLGCAYTLEVDDTGRMALFVSSGMVALAHNNREAVVPAFAVCRARPALGPGTPYLQTASERLQKALERFDFEGGGTGALRIVLSEARAGDGVTLWNLLKRTEGRDRELVFEQLAKLTALPEEATKEGLLRLDQQMLDLWLEKIEQARVNPYAKVDPAPGSIELTGNMETDRSWHRATLLPDGRVLVTGGIDSHGNALASAEIYDPATDAFTPAADMNSKRAAHTATRLADGRVLITGGTESGNNTENLARCEIYEPADGRFIPVGEMNVARSNHEATLMMDGRVLITGGVGSSAELPWLRSAEIYDPATDAFTPTGDMREPRADHTATLMADGKVLVTGGYGNRGFRQGVTSTADIYDPALGTFLPAADMSFHRFKHSAVLLKDGRVLIAGGIASRADERNPRTTAELYDPATNSFVKTGDMVSYRYKVKNAATLMADGKVLIAGGSWGLEVYDPATGRFSMSTGRMTPMRYYSTATLLPTGEAVIIGGYSGIQPDDYYHASAGAWIYRPE